jgi:hypothetical protein
LYQDLYIFGYKGQANADRLIILLCEDVTDSIAAQESMVQAANENTIKVDYLAATGDYIDKIINSLGDVLLVTGTSGTHQKSESSCTAIIWIYRIGINRQIPIPDYG